MAENDVVARLPPEAGHHGAQRSRGRGREGDFINIGSKQRCQVLSGLPFNGRVQMIELTELAGLLTVSGDRVLHPGREGRHRGVGQEDPLPANGKLALARGRVGQDIVEKAWN